MSNYQVILKSDRDFNPASEAISMPKLPPGTYRLNFDPESGRIWFTEFDIHSDDIVDLPETAYDQVVNDLQMFLTPSCADRHSHVSILHKMNVLLYGAPGTGKSVIVNRVAKEVMKEKGVVLFNPHPKVLIKAFELFDKIQPETRVLVIFEELDQLIDDYEEGSFLHILDGELQKHNAMFIATTNFINEIPMRIRRPGRFALRLEVGFPNRNARVTYLRTKLKDSNLVEKLADETSGFSIDNLKEVVRSGYCMQKDYFKVINNLRKEFSIGPEGPEDPSSLADDGGSEDYAPFTSPILKPARLATRKLPF